MYSGSRLSNYLRFYGRQVGVGDKYGTRTVPTRLETIITGSAGLSTEDSGIQDPPTTTLAKQSKPNLHLY